MAEFSDRSEPRTDAYFAADNARAMSRAEEAIAELTGLLDEYPSLLRRLGEGAEADPRWAQALEDAKAAQPKAEILHSAALTDLSENKPGDAAKRQRMAAR